MTRLNRLIFFLLVFLFRSLTAQKVKYVRGSLSVFVSWFKFFVLRLFSFDLSNFICFCDSFLISSENNGLNQK